MKIELNAKYLQASCELNELKAKYLNASSKMEALSKQSNEKDQRIKAIEQELSVLNAVCNGITKKVER